MDAHELALDAARHLELAAVAVIAAAVLGVPLGLFAASHRLARGLILAFVSIARTLPSLAVLALALPFLGVGTPPAIFALCLLAIAPIVANTDVGLRGVPPDALDAARGLGMNALQRFARVRWPLAFPTIFAGMRTATVETIASATLVTFVGAGGLGNAIVRGMQTGDQELVLAGAAAAAGLAIGAEMFLALLQRRIEART